METTPYIWFNGAFLPWNKAQTHLLTHTLHYGCGVFEGIRVYNTDKGPAIFRLQDHTKRFFYSAKKMMINVPYSEAEWNEATIETVRKNKLMQGYIRPIIYLGYGKMGVDPKGARTDCAIACWPWGKYLSEDPIDVKIVKTRRLHPNSCVPDAKVTGHYFNSIMAIREIQGTHYREALLLDYKGNVAEGPGENFFIVKKNDVLTPPHGNILPGITRDTVMRLARDLGYRVQEKILKPRDVYQADETFFTGTAAEVTPIKSVDDHVFGNGAIGPVTSALKTAYMDAVMGKNRKYQDWLTLIE